MGDFSKWWNSKEAVSKRRALLDGELTQGDVIMYLAEAEEIKGNAIDGPNYDRFDYFVGIKDYPEFLNKLGARLESQTGTKCYFIDGEL